MSPKNVRQVKLNPLPDKPKFKIICSKSFGVTPTEIKARQTYIIDRINALHYNESILIIDELLQNYGESFLQKS